jgi:hypothetical protein
MTTPAEQFIGYGEIATYLRTSIWTVMRWANGAGLPVYREGAHGRIVADRDEVRAWYAQRRRVRSPARTKS